MMGAEWDDEVSIAIRAERGYISLIGDEDRRSDGAGWGYEAGLNAVVRRDE